MENREYILSYFKTLLYVANADGRMGENKSEILSIFCTRIKITQLEINEVCKDPEKIQFVTPESFEDKLILIYDLLSLAMTDSQQGKKGIECCYIIASGLNIEKSTVDLLFAKFLKMMLNKKEVDVIQETISELEIQNKIYSSMNMVDSVERAKKLYEEGDFNDAIKLCNDILYKNENLFYPLLIRGNSYSKLNQHEDAENDLSILTHNFPQSEIAFYFRAHNLVYLKNYHFALMYANKAIEINPKYWQAYVTRGVSKQALNIFDSAIDDYNKAIEMCPKEGAIYRNRAIVKEKIEDFEGAKEDYNTAININPNDKIAVEKLLTLTIELIAKKK